MIKVKIVFAILCLCLSLVSSQGQTYSSPKIALYENYNNGRGGTYIATNYIVLLSGFVFRANSANLGYMYLKISGNTYPSIPDDSNLPLNPPSSTDSIGNDQNVSSVKPDINDGVFRGLPMESTITMNGNNNYINSRSFLYPVIWLKTTPVQPEDQNGYYHWKDVGLHRNTFHRINTDGSRSEYFINRNAITTLNFNPAIDLCVDTLPKEIICKSNLKQQTIVSVFWEKGDFSDDKLIFSISDDNRILFRKQLIHSAKNGSDFPLSTNHNGLIFEENKGISINNFAENRLKVVTFYKAEQSENDVWEQRDSVRFIFAKNEGSVQRFDGYIPEFLVFDKLLTKDEAVKYESYLAIKYGITKQKKYISSTGKHLWNTDESSIYNNRVFGYGRDDHYNLLQYQSTTSHDEFPYHLLTNNDSYFLNNSLYKSSPTKLLVAGKENGRNIMNEDYTMIGDNNELLIADVALPNENRITRLRRVWEVKKTIKDTSSVVDWSGKSINIEYKNDFLCNLSIQPSSETAYIISNKPLSGKNGYVAWRSSANIPMFVKFGRAHKTIEPNSYDTGYSFYPNGHVKAIINGVVSQNIVSTIASSDYVEIEKMDTVVFLRINGKRMDASKIVFPNIKQDVFIVLSVASIQNVREIDDFRVGGISNNGDQLELSYANTWGSLFTPTNNVCLLIDKTGTAQFHNPEIIFPTDIDQERTKLIYRNIFWGDNALNKVHFSFAVVDTTIIALRSKKDAIIYKEAEAEAQLIDEISVYNPDVYDMSRVMVKVKTTGLSKSYISFFDISGRKVLEQILPESDCVQYAEFNLPFTGVYIVKVTTSTRQYSCKVLVK